MRRAESGEHMHKRGEPAARDLSPKLAPDAFDGVAQDFDDDFTRSALGRMLRARVRSHLAQHFVAGDQVLELACGTGQDAR